MGTNNNTIISSQDFAACPLYLGISRARKKMALQCLLLLPSFMPNKNADCQEVCPRRFRLPRSLYKFFGEKSIPGMLPGTIRIAHRNSLCCWTRKKQHHRRALILGNNFCIPILRASGRLRLFSSTMATYFYTKKYRYSTSSLLLELIRYEGLELKVFYLF